MGVKKCDDGQGQTWLQFPWPHRRGGEGMVAGVTGPVEIERAQHKESQGEPQPQPEKPFSAILPLE